MSKKIIKTETDNLAFTENQPMFFDIKRYAAKKQADELFGRGIIVQADNKSVQEYLERTFKFNNFNNLMLQCAEDVNYYGRQIILINKLDGDDYLTLEIITP